MDNTSPPPDAPSPSPPQPETERETVVDPRVVALRGMFPDYDDLILQSVLQSANGNQDRAIDILLGMSDPDYRPEQPTETTAPQQPTPVLTQEELDEQFARQLVMQEQQQQQQRWMQSQAQGNNPPAVYQSSRPGAGRGGAGGAWVPAPQSPQQQQQQGQGQAPMAEFQEQFNKIAESGKKTFGNIFSKVKAKIQELDQGSSRPAQSSAPYQPTQQQQQQWSPPPVQPQPQHPAAYFDPNPNPNISPSVSPARTPASQVQVQGYDASPSPPTVASSVSPPLQPSTPSISTTQQLQPQPTPQPTTTATSIPPPPATSQGAPIDVGKLGLLPKRPVSLLRDPNAGSPSTSPPTAAVAASHQHYNNDDDDDGLEYAESPFEEDAKK